MLCGGGTKTNAPVQEQHDAKFLEVFTSAAGVTKADDGLRLKILAVRQRLRTELLDKGLLACMPPAERIAAALVFCQLDSEKAQRLLQHNGAGTFLVASAQRSRVLLCASLGAWPVGLCGREVFKSGSQRFMCICSDPTTV